MVTKVMWRHTKVKVSNRSAPMVPLCLKFGAIPTIIYKVTAFWRKWHVSFFFDRPPSWKCQLNHTGFQAYPSPKWKMADPRNFGPIRAFFYRVNIARCNLCARAKVKGHKAKNRRKHFRGKIGQAISNLVAVLVSDLWAMAGKNGSFFQQLAAILNVPFRPNWLLNLS